MTPRWSRLTACLAAVVLAGIGPQSARAQSPQPGSRGRPAEPRPADPRGKSVLEAARAAVSELKSLSYTAKITAPGQKLITSDVLIKKADAGGWKLYARAGEKEAPQLAAYDGLSVRALDDEHKIVWDQSTEKVHLIRGVFARRGVDQGMIWELLGDEDWLQADVDFQGTATVDGVACEVVTLRTTIERLRLPPTAPGRTPAPREGDAPGQEAPPRPDTTAAHEARLFLSTADHLPRRIIRKSDPGPGPFTVNISEIEADKAIPDTYFNIDTPAGYTVKAANPSPAPQRGADRTPRRDRPDDAGPGAASFGLAVGSEAPAFTLKDAAGREHSLADYRGRVVVLDFWGSWCPPCRAAMPGIQSLHERYMDHPVAVLGLNFEQSPKADPAKYMKDKGFTYGLLLKAETIANTYKVRGWPTFYIVDRDGRIAWSAIGHDPAHEAEMSKVIDALLAK